MRVYRFAIFLIIFFFFFLITVNLYNYHRLKSENEKLKGIYENLQREYTELRNLEKKLQEMKKDGKVRGDDIPQSQP